jgi:exopolysaccharide biosynthesis polyprenyl glycosylphosphotransferase
VTLESSLPHVTPATEAAALITRVLPDVQVTPREAVPTSHTYPWERAAGAVHAGSPRWGVVLLDGLLLAGLSAALRVGPLAAGLSLAGLVVTGRTYRDRDRVEARGLAWWPATLAGPVLAGSLADAGLGADSGRQALLYAVAASACLLALRGVCWIVVLTARQRGRGLEPALVVGAGDRAATLARTLERHPDFGLVVASRVGPAVLADPTLLADVVRSNGSRQVFLVADGSAPVAASGNPLRRAAGIDAYVSLIPAVSDALLSTRPTRRVGGVAVLPLGRPLLGPRRMWGKRAFDIVGSAVLLVLAAPVLGLAALAIRLDDGGPCLFRQTRTGRCGSPFQIYKLRTMRVDAQDVQGALTSYNTSDGLLFKMAADPRVTRVGWFLRRSGLDELPQLLNVLRGQMSLVGPRPLPVESEAFSARDGERHLVRPGMTGLWQVSGGASLRYREMVDLDLAYVHGWTPTVDAYVLLATIGVLIRATLARGATR